MSEAKDRAFRGWVSGASAKARAFFGWVAAGGWVEEPAGYISAISTANAVGVRLRLRTVEISAVSQASATASRVRLAEVSVIAVARIRSRRAESADFLEFEVSLYPGNYQVGEPEAAFVALVIDNSLKAGAPEGDWSVSLGAQRGYYTGEPEKTEAEEDVLVGWRAREVVIN